LPSVARTARIVLTIRGLRILRDLGLTNSNTISNLARDDYRTKMSKELEAEQEQQAPVEGSAREGAGVDAAETKVARKKQSAETRQRRSEAARKRWQNPEYRKRQRKARTESLRKAWQDPKYRARMSEARRETWQDPEVRRRQSEGVRKALQDPKVRARMSKSMREKWRDPEHRARVSKSVRETLQDPKLRARLSETSRETWRDPEVRALRSEGMKLYQDLVALGRSISEEAGLEPAPNSELAMLAEMFLEETGVES
jgi:hypothetical protein